MKLFSKEMMFLDNEFETSDQLFQFVSKKALELGYAKEGFYEGLKNREDHYPTALPGTTVDIAVPHTEPEFILKPFIAVLRCKNGVPFVQMGSDDLIIHPKLFFVLGFKREGCEKYQVKALQLLINYFVTKDDGKLALEFLAADKDLCLSRLLELENELVTN